MTLFNSSVGEYHEQLKNKQIEHIEQIHPQVSPKAQMSCVFWTQVKTQSP